MAVVVPVGVVAGGLGTVVVDVGIGTVVVAGGLGVVVVVVVVGVVEGDLGAVVVGEGVFGVVCAGAAACSAAGGSEAGGGSLGKAGAVFGGGGSEATVTAVGTSMVGAALSSDAALERPRKIKNPVVPRPISAKAAMPMMKIGGPFEAFEGRAGGGANTGAAAAFGAL